MPKNITICHLYGNLLNSYGDLGNLMILEYYLKSKGYTVQIDMISLEQEMDYQHYDLIFIGGGQDYEQKIVAKDIVRHRDGLKKYIEDAGCLIAICGGYQLLGESWVDGVGVEYKGADVLPIYTKYFPKRCVGQIKIKTDQGEILHGFENHSGRTFFKDHSHYLGKVIDGKGNNGKDKTEGFAYKNTYCTYMHGPFLVKNETFAKALIEEMIKRKKERKVCHS
ncbi:type 1 glutamine amidotransferase [Listeria ilorinensis]|uniref:type 1 glutamine amidotransferase n=1 Tax=Listeria ilorinensis TaxID=2867439 RepID=UPI001EF52127|nr:glutamine amidotransferase [Listeria ilorinensis]